MNIKQIHIKLLLVVLSIIVTLGLIINLSYAAFTISKESEHKVLTFGDISISLCYSAACTSSNELMGNILGTVTNNGETSFLPQYPISDSEYLEKVIPYKFEVENDGKLDLYLSLYLMPDTTSEGTPIEENRILPNTADITGRNVSGNNQSYTQNFTSFVSSSHYKYFKVAIKEANTDTPLIKTYDSVTSMNNLLVDNIYLPKNAKKTYLLYIWLSKEELLNNQNEENINEILGKYIVIDLSAKGEYKPN